MEIYMRDTHRKNILSLSVTLIKLLRLRIVQRVKKDDTTNGYVLEKTLRPTHCFICGAKTYLFVLSKRSNGKENSPPSNQNWLFIVKGTEGQRRKGLI